MGAPFLEKNLLNATLGYTGCSKQDQIDTNIREKKRINKVKIRIKLNKENNNKERESGFELRN
jgi:hypothetical protein